MLGAEVAIESARRCSFCCCAFRNALFQQLNGHFVGIMDAIFAVMFKHTPESYRAQKMSRPGVLALGDLSSDNAKISWHCSRYSCKSDQACDFLHQSIQAGVVSYLLYLAFRCDILYFRYVYH